MKICLYSYLFIAEMPYYRYNSPIILKLILLLYEKYQQYLTQRPINRMKNIIGGKS